MYYEETRGFGLRKNKANQSQFQKLTASPQKKEREEEGALRG